MTIDYPKGKLPNRCGAPTMCGGGHGWTSALSPRRRFGGLCCVLKLCLDSFTRITDNKCASTWVYMVLDGFISFIVFVVCIYMSF